MKLAQFCKACYGLLVLLFFTFNLQATEMNKQERNARLAYFCRVWGLLKYYPTGFGRKTADFDSLFLKTYPKIRDCATNDEFTGVLKHFLDTLQVLPTNEFGAKPPKKSSKKPGFWEELDDSTKYAWKPDLAWISKDSTLGGPITQRLRWHLTNYKPGKNRYFASYYYLTYYDEKKYAFNMNRVPDEMQMLTLARYWNIIHYFYPYKKYMDEPWNGALTELIPYYTDSFTYPFVYKIGKMVAWLHDSHVSLDPGPLPEGFVNNYLFRKNRDAWRYLPFEFLMVDSNPVISQIYKPTHGANRLLQKGDVLLGVNKLDLFKAQQSVHEYRTSSTQQNFKRIFPYYFVCLDTTFEFKILHGKDTVICKNRGLTCDSLYFIRGWTNPGKSYYFLNDSTGFVNLSLLTEKEYKKARNVLHNAKAIIFDMRGYPNRDVADRISGMFAHHRRKVDNFNYSDQNHPGAFRRYKKLRFVNSYYNYPNHFRKIYKGKVIVLMNGNTQSMAERTCMIIRAYCPTATFIGEPTSGTRGEIQYFYLPDGSSTCFSGRDVFWPDGTQLQRKGIQPDILALPTIESIKQGKDIELERALQYLETGK